MTLNGRDPDGFVPGSEAQRDYLKALALGVNADESESPRAKREEARRIKAEARQERRMEAYRQALIIPEWWGDIYTRSHRNGRHIARQKAIRAAFELGVDVPGWVRDKALPTPEDVAKIREASLARYREAER